MIWISCWRCLAVFAVALSAVAHGLEEDWARFRGANGSGRTAAAGIPRTWSDSENVRWKIDLPGPGSSSPIVFGERVYVTCYTGYGVDSQNPGEPENLERHLICYDLKGGREEWRSTVKSAENEDPYKDFIVEHGFASSTPVTDGTRIFMSCGKTGLAAFDMNGKQLWLQSLGSFSDPAMWGDGSSPILWNNLVIVNAGNTGHRFVALNAEDGSEVWRVENEKFTNCWSTPILVKASNRDELVCSAPGRIFGLDPATGRELWFAESPLTETVCSSPIEHEGVVFVMGGRAGTAVAVRCGGDGDVTATHTVWKAPLPAGIATAVVIDGRMYWSGRGLVICASCADGSEIFKERIDYGSAGSAAPPAPAAGGGAAAGGGGGGGGGGARPPRGRDYASPIAVGNQILMLNGSGKAHWIEASGNYTPVGTNSFSDDSFFNGTPAVAGDSLLIRSNKRLYCIGSPK